MATKTMVVNTKGSRPRSPLKFRQNRHLTLSFNTSDKMQKFADKRNHCQYPPVRNLLAEQEQKPMNQTYTIGSNLRQSATAFRQQRSSSIDSDFAEYGQQFGQQMSKSGLCSLIPRSFANKTNICRKPANQSQTITRMLSSQLPLIDGCSPERLCCQRPWTRTQLELAEFKKTLNQMN